MKPWDGSLKPMCMACLRRAFGCAKKGGWWCDNCQCWIVKPPKSKKPAPSERTER